MSYAVFTVRFNPSSGRRVLLRSVHDRPTAAVEILAGLPWQLFEGAVNHNAFGLMDEVAGPGWRDETEDDNQ